MSILKSIFQQIIILLLFSVIPYLWLLSFNHRSIIDTHSNWYIVLTFGLVLFIDSWLYLKLPLDLIPNCIPYIGHLDNSFAYMFMLFGIYTMIFGLFIAVYPYIKPYIGN